LTAGWSFWPPQILMRRCQIYSRRSHRGHYLLMGNHWVFVVGVGLLMAFVAVGTVRSGQLLASGWTPPANLLLSLPDTLARFVLIAACVALGSLAGPDSAALGWGIAYLPQDLGWGLIAGLLLAAVLAGSGKVIERRWGAAVYDDRLIRSILPANPQEWAGVILALLPAAALEELLFRSLPLGGLTWLASPWWLMWPLALVFGLLHWPQGSWGVIGTTLTAIALSWLFLATGSLWGVLVAHYVINVVQLILARQQMRTTSLRILQHFFTTLAHYSRRTHCPTGN
jgi:membrane protease YdiL (CAAX protease family)